MFRISRRLDYGLQLMISLAANQNNHPQPTAYLAKELDIPLPFLHQIGHTLMQAGLIKATPGPRGGLRLNQPAASITVLKILETLEGPIRVNPCIDNESGSSRQEGCATQFIWDDLQQTITTQLSNVTLDTLVNEAQSMPFYAFAFKSENE